MLLVANIKMRPDPQASKVHAKTASGSIYSLFTWTKSLEGGHFWNTIYNRLRVLSGEIDPIPSDDPLWCNPKERHNYSSNMGDD
jgi:hypothetical protein